MRIIIIYILCIYRRSFNRMVWYNTPHTTSTISCKLLQCMPTAFPLQNINVIFLLLTQWNFENYSHYILILKGNAAYKKNTYLLWMKTIHYPNTIRSHLVTIVPMAPFTPKSTSKLRSALHIRYSIVIRRFIYRANTALS